MTHLVAFELNPTGQPDVQWHSGMDMPEGTACTARFFNNHETQALLAQNEKHAPAVRDEETGIEYVVNRKYGDSLTDFVLAIAPTGSGVDAARRLRASFFYHSLSANRIYDEKGDPLPVIMMGAPSRTSKVNLGSTSAERTEKRREIASGNVNSVGGLYVDLARRIEPSAGRMHVTGFSLGGALALSGAAVAPRLSLDVVSAAAGDPANNTTDRDIFQLVARDFAREASLLGPAVEAAGVRAFSDVLAKESSIGFLRNVAAKNVRKLNYALLKAQTTDSYKQSVDTIMANSADTAVTIGVGGDNDHIAAKPQFAEHAATTRLLHGMDRFHLVEVTDGSHSWGDNILLHSAFLAYAIARSQ